MDGRIRQRTPAQLAAEGFAALVEKLGVADAIRWLHVHGSGHGDYARDRVQWLDGLDAAQIQRLMANVPLTTDYGPMTNDK
jgi:hypothetical protein